jgi:hypothetical protein
MDAAGEDNTVADEGVSVGQAGCISGKPRRPSSALCLKLPVLFPQHSILRKCELTLQLERAGFWLSIHRKDKSTWNTF